MTLVYDGPPYKYTTFIPAGTRALRQALDAWMPATTTQVVRERARCDAAPSEHCEARAIDVFSPDKVVRRLVFEVMVQEADELGVQSVIADRRVWGFGTWRERDYTGPNAHTDHCHIGLTRAAAQSLTIQHCRQVLGLAGPDQEVAVDEATIRKIAAAVWEHGVANLVSGGQRPAHNVLEWANLDANTGLKAGQLVSEQVAEVLRRLEAIEQRLAQ